MVDSEPFFLVFLVYVPLWNEFLHYTDIHRSDFLFLEVKQVWQFAAWRQSGLLLPQFIKEGVTDSIQWF